MVLGQILVQAGAISDAQLQAATAEQMRWGIKLDRALVRMGAISDELLAMVLARALGVPRAEPDGVAVLPPECIGRIDAAICTRLRAIPMRVVAEQRAAQVAFSDPLDRAAIDEVSRLLGVSVEVHVAADDAVMRAVGRLFGTPAAGLRSTPSASRPAGEDDPASNSGNRIVRPLAGPPSTPGYQSTPAQGWTTNAPSTSRPLATAVSENTTRFAPAPGPASHVAASPNTGMWTAPLSMRIDEHVRVLRAVGGLLFDRGVIRPGDKLPPMSR